MGQIAGLSDELAEGLRKGFCEKRGKQRQKKGNAAAFEGYCLQEFFCIKK